MVESAPERGELGGNQQFAKNRKLVKTESMKINDGVMEGGNSPAMPAMFASFFSSKPHSAPRSVFAGSKSRSTWWSRQSERVSGRNVRRYCARLYASDAVGVVFCHCGEGRRGVGRREGPPKRQIARTIHI